MEKGKIMDEKKKETRCGLDISKNDMAAALDVDRDLPVHRLPCRKFPRTPDGMRALLAWCAELGADAPRLLMESTGIYSRDVLLWLHVRHPDMHVTVVNPRHAKHFIESEHLGNKTDELDAMALARMGTVQNPGATPPPPPEYLQLQELVRSRDQMVTTMRSLEVSLGAMADPGSVAAESLRAVIKTMGAELRRLNAALRDHVARTPRIRDTVARMCTMPGISVVSACTILSELGEFDPERTRGNFSAYTGLQPVQRKSGTSVNSSRIAKNGSPLLRKVIYLCSIHAVEKIPSLKSLHSRLVKKGRKPLAARCACMRKMLLILRSMVLNNKDFKENYEPMKRIGKVG